MTATLATTDETTARRTFRLDAALLAIGAVILRLPALLAARHLTFDDGVYGASALAMRHGERPFIDIFSPQGPLHLPLVYVFDLIGFRTLDAPRLVTVTSGVVVTIATYAIGRRLTSRGGALLAAGLVATSGSMLWVTGSISGDGPAAALAVTAVALALAYRDRPSSRRAAIIGVVLGAALCVKALVIPAAIPVGLVLLARRRRPDLALAVGAAVAVGVAAILPWGFDRVWAQSVAYHENARRLKSPLGNVVVLLKTLVERDPFVVLAVLVALALVAVGRQARRGSASSSTPRPVVAPRATVLLVSWLAAQVVLLAYDRAMFRPHIVHVVVPLALLASLRPAPWRVLAIGFVLVTPWWYSNIHDVLWPSDYSRDEQAVVGRLRALPAGALVISDDPGFAWRAEHRIPGYFVDTSMQRVQEHELTTDVVARAAAAHTVCAVVLWSPDRLGGLRGLPARLTDDGYEVVGRWGDRRILYERRDCRP